MTRKTRDAVFICGGDGTVVYPDTTSDCPERERHTPKPASDLEWEPWASRMTNSHNPRRCPGCGLWKVWEPKKSKEPRKFDGPDCGVDGCEREVGHIGDHRPLRTNDYQAGRSDSQAGSTFALVLQQKNWHVELFWNGSAGWFTARLVSLRDRDGRRDYPGGYLVPFDDPIGASGSTPEEALANLSEAVLEWA